jgi:hypothetical protein
MSKDIRITWFLVKLAMKLGQPNLDIKTEKPTKYIKAKHCTRTMETIGNGKVIRP